MRITLTNRERRLVALFEEETGATVHDCLVYDGSGDAAGAEADGVVVFLVAAGEMGQAVGPDGRRVHRVEERIGRRIDLVEDADTPEAFVESTLAPAVVRHVTVSEQGDRVAYVEVSPEDRGVAIGAGGQNIEVARDLAKRHYDIDDIRLT